MNHLLDFFLLSVLIETLWNVKSMVKAVLKSQLSVLIETLWNVKRVRRLAIRSLRRINRNIVECKDEFYIQNQCYRTCINRNIVECKDITLVSEQ